MKTIKKMIITGVFFLTGIVSYGQPGDKDSTMTPEERATKRTEKMKQELALSTDQADQVYAINLAHIIEMDKLREEQKALKEKMKEEKESTRKKIKEVLTPEQNVIFDQKADEREKKQEEKHKK